MYNVSTNTKVETSSDQNTTVLYEQVSSYPKEHNAGALYKLIQKITALERY